MSGGMQTEDWKAEWQPVVDAVGRDFSDGETVFGADPVERGAIDPRRAGRRRVTGRPTF